MLYREAGMYEQSIKHLEENQAFILDKLSLQELKGKLMMIKLKLILIVAQIEINSYGLFFLIQADSYLKHNRKNNAAEIYEALIERNPDNVIYYKKLEDCLNLSKKSII
jgi:tetratricopeptide (TPR) repeat protein